MSFLEIYSNGSLDRTYVIYNGDRLERVQELYVDLEETGEFDFLLHYRGTDGVEYHRRLFADPLDALSRVPESQDDTDYDGLTCLRIESEGDIDTVAISVDGEYQDGVVSLMAHIKKDATSSTLLEKLGVKPKQQLRSEFSCVLTVRYDDQTTHDRTLFL